MSTESRKPVIDMKLEVVVIPVSDVDRAKRFYENLGWRLDADFVRADGSRALQLTPPGSPTSIHLDKGSALPRFLIVNDIEAARAELIARGVDVSEVFHRGAAGRIKGPDPERPSYGSLATFNDPDGNVWLLQQSRSVCPDASTETARRTPHRPISPPRCAARPKPMASTRSGPAATMRTGRTGTPTTSCASRPASRCRSERSNRSSAIDRAVDAGRTGGVTP